MLKNYEMVRPGHWHQVIKIGAGPKYSTDYMKYYDTIPSQEMSRIRYNVIKQHIGDIETLCDFGYGNGSFLDYCNSQGIKTYGYDISDCPVPVGSMRINDIGEADVDVITFFDSLEHKEEQNLEPFLRSLKTKHIIISVPWLHERRGEAWFAGWKHRKPDEHFHHFDLPGLVGLLADSGFKLVHVGNEEDVIRKSVDNYPNILTVVASRIV